MRRPRQGSSALVVDPETPFWLQGNFAPVYEELDAFDLPVRGAIPPELNGLYVRNGSNPQSGVSPHWFFGDGMIHGVRFEGGRAAWYRNRYVRTPFYEQGIGFGDSVQQYDTDHRQSSRGERNRTQHEPCG